MLLFHHCSTISKRILALLLMIIDCNTFICHSLNPFSSHFCSYPFLLFFWFSSNYTFIFANPTKNQNNNNGEKLFLIASPLQIKLATVIKNTRFSRANESISDTKEINHKFDEEYNSNSYIGSTGNNSTFETSTSISVSRIGNKIYMVLVVYMYECTLYVYLGIFSIG